MANIIIPDEAKLNWLHLMIVDAPTLGTAVLRLTKSALTITSATVLTELEAVQCDYPGYTEELLTGWSSPVINAPNGSTEADQVGFESTDPDVLQDAHGFYVTDGSGARLLLAATFDVPIPISSSAQLRVAVEFLLDSIFSS